MSGAELVLNFSKQSAHIGILSLVLTGAGLPAIAASDAKALQCIRDFSAEVQNIKAYEAKILKRELQSTGRYAETQVHIRQCRDGQTTVTFLDEGQTGIKNNGMKVTFDGSPYLGIQLGKPKYLGRIPHAVAQVVVGEKLRITSPYVLDGEYFTVNRAGYFPLQRVLNTQLPSLEKTQEGGITSLDGCNLRYEQHTREISKVTVTEQNSIFNIEDQFGTLALFLLEANKDRFKSLTELFERAEGKEINVPKWFFDFDLTFDPVTHLPKVLRFKKKDVIVAEYTYELISAEKGN
jgi:hypothetical protein